nr:hypothetical protein [Klebsiella pneumoniae]
MSFLTAIRHRHGRIIIHQLLFRLFRIMRLRAASVCKRCPV